MSTTILTGKAAQLVVMGILAEAQIPVSTHYSWVIIESLVEDITMLNELFNIEPAIITHTITYSTNRFLVESIEVAVDLPAQA